MAKRRMRNGTEAKAFGWPRATICSGQLIACTRRQMESVKPKPALGIDFNKAECLRSRRTIEQGMNRSREAADLGNAADSSESKDIGVFITIFG